MSDGDAFDADTADDSDDALAAEYVLRLLGPAEAAAAVERAARDPAFAALVSDWRGRLAALDDAFDPVSPPRRLRARVEDRLFGPRASFAGRLWGSAGLWRGVAAAAVVAAVYLAAPWEGPPARLAASIAPAGGDVALLALFDPEAGALNVGRISGASPPPQRDHELWLIVEGAPPLSLGVLPREDRADVPLRADATALMAPGVTLAVTDEPRGGSPTGGPTGPVVAAGPVLGM